MVRVEVLGDAAEGRDATLVHQEPAASEGLAEMLLDGLRSEVVVAHGMIQTGIVCNIDIVSIIISHT